MYVASPTGATATVSLTAVPAADSAAKVQVEAQGTAELVLAAMDSLASNSRWRIAVTAVVCRKLDKREQNHRQNPNLFDMRKRDRVQTR